MRRNSTPSGSWHDLRNQEGFLLLGVLFMVLLITFALAVAAPKIAEEIRRDKEEETIHRGKQYARAIQNYYAKYNRYPNSIDQLMKTDNQRFLRKRYLDPMTGKDDWRIIHLGEATVPAMGLFGQSLQQPNGGITPTGATNGTNGTNGTGVTSNSSFGSSSSSSFGSSGSSFGSSGSSFGSSSSSFGGSSGSTFGNSGSSASPIGGTGSGSSSGFGSSSGSGFGSSAGSGFGSSTGIGGTTTTGGTATTATPGTTGSSGAFGTPGATFGGAPIVGVGLLDKRTSIKVYRKQTTYNKWEFVFDPTQNALNAMAGAPTNLSNGSNSSSTSGFGSSSGTGFGSSSGSGFGSSSGSGFGSSSGSGFGSNSGSGFGSSSALDSAPALVLVLGPALVLVLARVTDQVMALVPVDHQARQTRIRRTATRPSRIADPDTVSGDCNSPYRF